MERLVYGCINMKPSLKSPWRFEGENALGEDVICFVFAPTSELHADEICNDN